MDAPGNATGTGIGSTSDMSVPPAPHAASVNSNDTTDTARTSPPFRIATGYRRRARAKNPAGFLRTDPPRRP
ncbi:hypothetical protein Afil01_10790 [Actinorhabdospora filicis]|uniref:Uncharacterized protein n=1 Tax=Actinorhabdospora filicis TaxID=1785913 RepID=A0A9W6SHX7_9ACTN|nr:hypothetical protein Afil01_10790 [Actinorhabdospora filicis]